MFGGERNGSPEENSNSSGSSGSNIRRSKRNSNPPGKVEIVEVAMEGKLEVGVAVKEIATLLGTAE